MGTYTIQPVPHVQPHVQPHDQPHCRYTGTANNTNVREIYVADIIAAGFGGKAWKDGIWKAAADLELSFFHPLSSTTHPRTYCRVTYDRDFLYWSFIVKDRWVRAHYMEYQDPVCQDSCVEFFVQPVQEAGYFNFEVNCIGTLQLLYIEDSARTQTGFMKATPVAADNAAGIKIWTSITERPYLPENQEPMQWRIDAAVPFSLFSTYIPGFIPPRPRTVWRGNFYKCADDSSHPHWASWAPIGNKLNFHVPECFGILEFA